MPQASPLVFLPDRRPRLREIFEKELSQVNLDLCLTCGLCSSGCPAAGIEDMDPRKLLRLILLGADEEVLTSPWIWVCTMCNRCKYACPMVIDIGKIVHRLRGISREEVKPDYISNLELTCKYQVERGNSTGIPNEDFVWLINDLLEEVHQDPAWKDLKAPVDKVGAEYFVNENAANPTFTPEEMIKIWKIFHVVGIDWTYSSVWWDGANYCIFTGDNAAWEYTVRKQVERVEELGCRYFIITECGHIHYALLEGVRRFNIPHSFEFVSIVTLYARWIREGRLKVDPSWNQEGLKVTVQDPCKLIRQTLGDEGAEDLRFVIKAVVGEENFVDVYPNASNNYCCGGGGGAVQINLTPKRLAMGRRKFEQLQATGADIVVTPCFNCHSQIKELGKHYGGRYEAVHLWDLIDKALVR